MVPAVMCRLQGRLVVGTRTGLLLLRTHQAFRQPDKNIEITKKHTKEITALSELFEQQLQEAENEFVRKLQYVRSKNSNKLINR